MSSLRRSRLSWPPRVHLLFPRSLCTMFLPVGSPFKLLKVIVQIRANSNEGLTSGSGPLHHGNHLCEHVPCPVRLDDTEWFRCRSCGFLNYVGRTSCFSCRATGAAFFGRVRQVRKRIPISNSSHTLTMLPLQNVLRSWPEVSSTLWPPS